MHQGAPWLPSADPQRSAVDGSLATDPAVYVQLLATDFGGIYQVYIAAWDERLKMLRLAMSFMAAPFGAVIALMSARVLDPKVLTAWDRLPLYVFGLILAAGLLSMVPYLRLIEATNTHLRTARVMNNFRMLYVRELKEHFDDLEWTPNLPIDARYPENFAPTSGPGVTVLILALLDAAYLAVGVIGLSGAPPTPMLLGVTVALSTVVLFFCYYIRSNVSRRRRQPANPYGFPTVET
jgi:hypothetical protein